MTSDEMEDTLKHLGIEVISITGDELRGHCPGHKARTGKEDNNPSWFINSDSGAHNCFSCGFKGNLYSLISYVTGAAYEDAAKWFESTDGLVARFNRIANKSEEKPVDDLPKVTESMLSAFTQVPDYALQARGLSTLAATNHGLRWDDARRLWIIPIRDAVTDNLLGWQEKGFDHRYFNNRPTGIKKGETLFGFDVLVTNWTVVVESPLDVVRLTSLGFPGVATFGTNVTAAQFSLLRGFDKIIVAMDNDEAGRTSAKQLLDRCNKSGLEAWFFNYNNLDVKDVGGMSLDEVRFGIQNAKHMLHGEKAI